MSNFYLDLCKATSTETSIRKLPADNLEMEQKNNVARDEQNISSTLHESQVAEKHEAGDCVAASAELMEVDYLTDVHQNLSERNNKKPEELKEGKSVEERENTTTKVCLIFPLS